jgi:hypothetical protein
VIKGGGDGGFDDRVVVTVNRGTPRADKVDELAIVGGNQRGAVCGLNEERRTADGAEGPNRRIHTAGNEAKGAGEQSVGDRIEHGKNENVKRSDAAHDELEHVELEKLSL